VHRRADVDEECNGDVPDDRDGADDDVVDWADDVIDCDDLLDVLERCLWCTTAALMTYACENARF
jgi:hypothetical protein